MGFVEEHQTFCWMMHGFRTYRCDWQHDPLLFWGNVGLLQIPHKWKISWCATLLVFKVYINPGVEVNINYWLLFAFWAFWALPLPVSNFFTDFIVLCTRVSHRKGKGAMPFPSGVVDGKRMRPLSDSVLARNICHDLCVCLSVCLSLRLSVCLSQVGRLSKQLNRLSWFWHRGDPRLRFPGRTSGERELSHSIWPRYSTPGKWVVNCFVDCAPVSFY